LIPQKLEANLELWFAWWKSTIEFKIFCFCCNDAGSAPTPLEVLKLNTKIVLISMMMMHLQLNVKNLQSILKQEQWRLY